MLFYCGLNDDAYLFVSSSTKLLRHHRIIENKKLRSFKFYSIFKQVPGNNNLCYFLVTRRMNLNYVKLKIT